MKKINVFLGIILFSLLFAGCINLEYKAEQQFKDDGTSTLKTTERIGISESFRETYGKLPKSGSEDPSTIANAIKVSFSSSRDYLEMLCGLMDGVTTCYGDENGYFHTEKELSPGEFYEVKKEFDWVNLKEVTTYNIEKVPGAFYYLKGKEAEVRAATERAQRRYAEEKIDEYLTKDAYCKETRYSSIDCSFESFKNGHAAVVLSLSSFSSSKEIEWIACSDTPESEFYFMNTTEIKNAIKNKVIVNKTITSNRNASVSFNCPSNAESIVVFYLQRSSLSNKMEENSAVFEIKTKEEMKDEVLKQLEPSTSAGLFSGYTPGITTAGTGVSNAFLDFKKGEFLGSEFDKLAEGATTGTLYNMKINIEYKAIFPAKIVSAEIGKDKVPFEQNKIELTLEDLGEYSGGTLTVVTEKELSPLGVFTWVLLGAIVVIAAGVVISMMRR